ncbi:translation initiation factor IF-6 [Candidatus Woesearchaeota archaeon]|nr:translation initiation factor IF-6 [Candidatus Woesearchaeota archaeon]
MAHILDTNFDGNPNVGLYAFCTDKFCLLGKEINPRKAKEIEAVLKVPVHRINICGTSLLGVFIAGNSKCLLVPGIAFENELRVLDKLGIKYKVINTKQTALGNNILCNDEGAVVNPEFSADTKKEIRQALGVNLKPGTIAELDIVGSLGVAARGNCIIHMDASDDEIKKIEELLKVKCHSATVNLGNPYIKAGLFCNKNGFVIGDQSGGPEITMIDEYLGFL